MRNQSLLFTLRTLAWLALAIGTLLPTLAAAQSHILRVSLRDAGGTAIGGVSVIVRTEDGQELARQTTDSSGIASFGDLPGIVRVTVEGQARGGPQLYQLGDDARGVRLDLSLADGSANLDLRVERDGLVLPDPATMLTLEEGGPTVELALPFPTAAVATPALLLTTPVDASTAVVNMGEASAPAVSHRDGWVAPLTLLILVGTAAVLRLILKLRSEQ